MGSLKNNILFIYKNYTYDPCLHALKRWIKKLNNNAIYFEFSQVERPRGISKQPNKRLINLLRNNNFSFIITWNPLLNLDELIEIKRKKSINIIMLNGFTSLHSFNFKTQKEFFDYLREFDGYFIPMESHVDKLKKYEIKAFYSPFFVDPHKYKRKNFPKPINALFVGEVNQNWAINRYKFLKEISNKYKPVILSQSKHMINNSFRIRAIPFEAIINIFHNLSKVVFGSDFLPSLDPYNQHIKNPLLLYDIHNLYTIRARVFTVMSSGSAFVCEDHPELNNLFENEKEIMLWKNFDDLNNISDKLINDKKFNNKIALNGYKATISNHTVFHRLYNLEKIFSIKLFKRIDLKYL